MQHDIMLASCRRRPDSPATWYSLPEALAANIIARVAELSFRNIPTLRLVSKSWRDAMWAYQGLLSVRDEGRSHPEQMHTMCKILPHAGQLVIYSYMPIIMDSMRQLRRLRDVSLTFELHFGLGDKMEPPVDLSVLPPTVTKLNLNNIGLDMTSVEHIKFTLKALQVTLWEDGLAQTLAVLSRQLKLEVLSSIPKQRMSVDRQWDSHILTDPSYHILIFWTLLEEDSNMAFKMNRMQKHP